MTEKLTKDDYERLKNCIRATINALKTAKSQCLTIGAIDSINNEITELIGVAQKVRAIAKADKHETPPGIDTGAS